MLDVLARMRSSSGRLDDAFRHSCSVLDACDARTGRTASASSCSRSRASLGSRRAERLTRAGRLWGAVESRRALEDAHGTRGERQREELAAPRLREHMARSSSEAVSTVDALTLDGAVEYAL